MINGTLSFVSFINCCVVVTALWLFLFIYIYEPDIFDDNHRENWGLVLRNEI